MHQHRLVAVLCAFLDPLAGFKRWAPGKRKEENEQDGEREGKRMDTPIFLNMAALLAFTGDGHHNMS